MCPPAAAQPVFHPADTSRYSCRAGRSRPFAPHPMLVLQRVFPERDASREGADIRAPSTVRAQPEPPLDLEPILVFDLDGHRTVGLVGHNPLLDRRHWSLLPFTRIVVSATLSETPRLATRRPFIGGNWKMHTNRAGASELARGVIDGLVGLQG